MPIKKSTKKKIIKKIAKKAVKKTIKKPAKNKAVKRIIKKAVKAKKAVLIKKNMVKPMVNEKPIGRIVHYFDKIGVAVMSFDASVAVGDTIRIVGGENTDFEQEVGSMEVDHEKVQKAKKGDEVGMKVKEKVHEGYKVYKA
ncbi:MAG: hypothetical protein PHW31_03380 [Candidatus Pacebacteria bacterium]|nr:hypothetical protein [Candidatus Paceibacterota bacterium]